MKTIPHKIGIVGGSFDPLHYGHLIMAEYAIESLQLDLVLFVPVAYPPHKPRGGRVSIEHRIAMLQAAIYDNDRFMFSRVDVDRPGPHYTVDTIQMIQAQYPSSHLYFLMGTDSLQSFSNWYKPQQIIEQCRLAVMRRPSTQPITLNLHEDVLPGLQNSIDIIEAPAIGISSTRIVERIRSGQTIRYLIPEAVRIYIQEHDLYR